MTKEFFINLNLQNNIYIKLKIASWEFRDQHNIEGLVYGPKHVVWEISDLCDRSMWYLDTSLEIWKYILRIWESRYTRISLGTADALYSKTKDAFCSCDLFVCLFCWILRLEWCSVCTRECCRTFCRHDKQLYKERSKTIFLWMHERQFQKPHTYFVPVVIETIFHLSNKQLTCAS